MNSNNDFFSAYQTYIEFSTENFLFALPPSYQGSTWIFLDEKSESSSLTWWETRILNVKDEASENISDAESCVSVESEKEKTK